MMSISSTQTIASKTGAGIIAGTQAMSQSGAAASTQDAVKSISGGAGGNGSWPFDGSSVQNNDGGI